MKSLYFKGPLAVEANGVANIHISYNVPLTGSLSIHYGDCDFPIAHPKSSHHQQVGETHVGDHELAKRNSDWKGSRPERFLWVVPRSATDDGCLSAYSGEDLVGRSEPVSVMKRQVRRDVIVLGDIGDAEGP